MSGGLRLAKDYGRLSPRERLTLLIEARAHGDQAEASRLIDSVPVCSYRAGDYAFYIPHRALRSVTVAAVWDIRQAMGRLAMLGAYEQLTSMLLEMAAIESAGKTLDAAEEDCGCGAIAKAIEEHRASTPADEQEAAGQQVMAWLTQGAKAAAGEILQKLRRREQETLHCTYAAFDRFCQKAAGVSAKTLLLAWLPRVLDEVREAGLDMEEPPADQEMVKQFETAFLEAWNREVSG